MNLSTELVLLALPTFTYNTLLDVFTCLCVCSRHDLDTSFSESVSSIHVCLIVHATWLHFTYSLGCFLLTLRPACPDPRAWTVDFPATKQSCAAVAWWTSCGFFLLAPFWLALEISCCYSEHFPALVLSISLCISLCNSYFAPLGDVIFL